MIVYKLQRDLETKDSTIGKLWSYNGDFMCHVLEDGFRPVKIKKETRIPTGMYKLELKKDGTHHFKYLKYYAAMFGENWHQGMIHLLNVPEFKDILVHCGNDVEDTEGCLLVGLFENKMDSEGNYTIQNSRAAYQTIYPEIRDSILEDETYLLVE